MRVCSIYVSLAHGLGGFVRDVSQTKTLFSIRRWTDGIVKKKVLYSPYTTSRTLSPILRWKGILPSLTDVAGECFLLAT